MRRAIELEGVGTTLELSKATAVKISPKVIHLDQMEDGTWRLTYSSELIPDFSVIQALVLQAKTVELEGTDTVLQLAKTVPVSSKAGMLHFDRAENGTWRLIYSRNLIPDFAKLTALRIIRED